MRSRSSSWRKSKGRDVRVLVRRQFGVERLEERYLLTATPLQIGYSMAPDPALIAQAQAAAVNSVNLLPVAPFPLEETFLLHSNPDATKTIYLDFDGFVTRNTQWNADYDLPNIVTPQYSLDPDFTTFSDTEKLLIQTIWEHASEDFRPFNVDVTTQDPGLDALRNTGGTDDEWGIRVVIGGSDNDWQNPVTGKPSGGIAYLTSFSWDTDTPCFVFAQDYGGSAYNIGETVAHETGHTLGLNHDGLFWFWKDSESGDISQEHEEYYAGHPRFDPALMHLPGPTEWAPIMGVGYGKPLTQWSFGEYPGADNIEDDLLTITTDNGFGYLPDDHADTRAAATPLDLDPDTADSEVNTYLGEGIIGEHPAAGVSDVDYFTFTVEGIGEVLTFDISPFQTGPNLDILAKLYDSSGALIATSNPVDDIAAGSQTFDATIADSGWVDASGQQITEFSLGPGTYYLSVEGTGKPITFIDPSYHPLIEDPDGAPDAPKLPFDQSDWGYSNYGSLGYYSITGTRKKSLVVGVDFDVSNGTTPKNWHLYSGGGPTDTITGLTSEAGVPVPYTLLVSTTGASIETFASDNPIVGTDVPAHPFQLKELKGFISAQNQTTTFTWGNLEPWSFHTIYVFGHADFAASNHVVITGGNLNGTVQTVTFDQTIAANHLVVNEGPSSNEDLSTFAINVLSDASGQIKIDVSGATTAIAGLAIAPTRPIGPAQNGSVSGQKWNDLDGDKIKDASEPGLAGWTIYIDEDNDGELDSVTTGGTPSGTFHVDSVEVGQQIPDADPAGVKSSLAFTNIGTIVDINVSLDISHTYDGDLEVNLISPLGTHVQLFSHVGVNGDNFANTVFDDSAATSITNANAPFTGTFRPQAPLSVLNGESAAGTWQLEVIDPVTGDSGVLNAWSVTIQVQGEPGVTEFIEDYRITDSNGDYSFDDLPPGLYTIREFISPQQVIAGWKQTWAPTPITVTSGADIEDHDFGNWIPTVQFGSIQGQKYLDANQNGVKDQGEAGLPGWIVYIDANNNGIRDVSTTPTILSSTNVPKPIEDLKTTQSQLTVGALGSVLNLEVTLDITHSYMGDLEVYLTSPSGRRVELFTEVGGQYNDFHNLTLSDNANRSISTIGFNDLPYSGTWRPEGALSLFSGDDAAGIWTLSITDTTEADQGTLNSWSLSFSSGELFRTTDAEGNYQFGPVDAGTYIVREEPKPGWTAVPPNDTTIPGASWSSGGWFVTVVATDDPNDPDGPDSHRNVRNVDFGNFSVAALAGDYNRDGTVDGSDYVVWRRALGSQVTNFSGADGDGNGIVEQADFTVWRLHFGQTFGGSGSGSGLADAAAGSGADAQSAQVSEPVMAEATSTSISTEQAPLPAAVASDAGVVTTSDSAKSPVASMQVYEIVNISSVIEHDATVIERPSESTSPSDLGLLAWLAASSVGERPQTDATSWTDKDFSAPSTSDGQETLAAAFELLADDALLSAAI